LNHEKYLVNLHICKKTCVYTQCYEHGASITE